MNISLQAVKTKMSIIPSTKGKDQLLLEGYRCRRDRLIWYCVKDPCKGLARYNGTPYEMYQSHVCQATNPEELGNLYIVMKLEEKLKTLMINHD